MGFKPPPEILTFFWKSEGNEVEKKRKKRKKGVGWGGLPLNNFGGIEIFLMGLGYFQGG